MDFRPTLCLDFDGVIHKYSKGWDDGTIYDGPTDGFFDWAIDAKEFFKLVIYSSRSKTEDGVAAMRVWLRKQIGELHPHAQDLISVDDFEFVPQKPIAFLTIDDRALQFKGEWNSFMPKDLLNFKPWNQE